MICNPTINIPNGVRVTKTMLIEINLDLNHPFYEVSRKLLNYLLDNRIQIYGGSSSGPGYISVSVGIQWEDEVRKFLKDHGIEYPRV